MIKPRAIGVHREVKKAGKPESDRMILRATAKSLRQMGVSVSLSHPEKLKPGKKVNVIFTMARTPQVHKILEEYSRRGVGIVNSPRAVADSLNRRLSYERLKKAGIPIPETKFVKIAAIKPEKMKGKFIFKRPDRHEFTVVVSNPQEINNALAGYKKQGLKEIVLQRFVEGTHVKFYAIGEKVFLPEEIEKSVGNELLEKIREYAMKSGLVSGLKVFGGDMIVSGKKAFVVDLNDWPSFSSIREKAASDIAELIYKEQAERKQ